ncbi:GNAT family N-acetyltransferase [Chloroflexota bacterium]
MVHVFQVTTTEHQQQVRKLFWEYLVWANTMTTRRYNLDLDIATMLREDMAELENFMPPTGRLLLAEDHERIAGLACLLRHDAQTAELKRMYVRITCRGRGVGRTLLQAIIDEARTIGYTKLRLDSTSFMREAHQLYESMGFARIAPYSETEIPTEFHPHWVFMELNLDQE